MEEETGAGAINPELEDLDLDTEDIEEVKARLAEERAARVKEVEARRQLTARAKAAEEKLKEPPREDVTKDVAELKLESKKRQVGYRLGLDPEETDRLFRFAGDSDPEEVFKDEFFQAGLKETRKAKRVEESIPSSSNRSPRVEGKTFAEMTSEERKKNWSKVVAR